MLYVPNETLQPPTTHFGHFWIKKVQKSMLISGPLDSTCCLIFINSSTAMEIWKFIKVGQKNHKIFSTWKAWHCAFLIQNFPLCNRKMRFILWRLDQSFYCSLSLIIQTRRRHNEIPRNEMKEDSLDTHKLKWHSELGGTTSVSLSPLIIKLYSSFDQGIIVLRIAKYKVGTTLHLLNSIEKILD